MNDDRPITPEVWREVTGSDGAIYLRDGWSLAWNLRGVVLIGGGDCIDLHSIRTAHDLRELLRLLGEKESEVA